MSVNYQWVCVLGLRIVGWAHLLLVTDPLILHRLEIIISVSLTSSYVAVLIPTDLCGSSPYAHLDLTNRTASISHLSLYAVLPQCT